MYENFLMLTMPAALLFSVMLILFTFIVCTIIRCAVWYRAEIQKKSFQKQYTALSEQCRHLAVKNDELTRQLASFPSSPGGCTGSAAIAKDRISQILPLRSVRNDLAEQKAKANDQKIQREEFEKKLAAEEQREGESEYAYGKRLQGYSHDGCFKEQAHNEAFYPEGIPEPDKAS